ncbi:MAG: MCE family protein [Rhodococcus sp. (in: high G+C Gram-positive bacteria)]
MTAPPRRLGPNRASLVVRGITASVVIVAAAVAAVAYGGGAFDRGAAVHVDIPASAGLLIGEISVQYNGVQVGTVVDIDSGIERSTVTMRIDATDVPASSMVRVVPRTLFGDVYLRLVDDGSDPAQLASGDELAMDTSTEAVQLSEVYRRVTGLLERLEPAKAQIALTEISTALRGRGDSLGATIDRLASLTAVLEPRAQSVIDHTPQTRTLAEALAEATPDILATVEATTTLSQTMLARSRGVENLLTNAATLGNSASIAAQENTSNSITVIHNGAPVLRTTAENSSGLGATLDMFEPFGAAGARIFASGRFDITAVPDFSSPLPYTAAHCPKYPGLDGPNCALAEIQDTATTTPQPLNPASTILLAPLLRGTEVRIR